MCPRTSEPSIALLPMQEKHLAAVVQIHHSRLTGLLKDLGPLAIRAFYQGALASDQLIAYVFLEDNRCVGFVMGSIKPLALRQSVLTKHRWPTLFATLLGAIRHPRLIPFLWHNALGKQVSDFDHETTELTYVATQETSHTRGIGKRLIKIFSESLTPHHVEHYELSVDADNQNAIGFYEHLGFELICSYEEFGQQHYRYRKVVT